VGHHRLQAAEQLGATEVPVTWVDVDNARALKIMLADNRTAELAHRDEEALASLLSELQLTDDLIGTGYADTDLTALLEELAQDTGTPEESPPPLEPPRLSLAERFLAPPFSILDTRQGYWNERKRAWLALGLQSELGRDIETFAQSSQPPGVYNIRNELRLSLKREPSWDETIAEAKRRGIYIAPGVSIFDPALCEVMYSWFAPTNATILDPFAGGSVRGVVAAKLGHAYTGIELRPEQVQANRTNWAALEQKISARVAPVWIEGDSQDIPALVPDIQVDLVFSCPPYFDLEVYSDNPNDLSNQDDYPAFLKMYRVIIARALERLKPNRFAVFVVTDVRGKDGMYVGLLRDTITAFEDCGAQLYNELALINSLSSAAIRAGRMFSAKRKTVRVHQNVLVFYKGDHDAIPQHFGPVHIPDLSAWLEDKDAPPEEG